MRSRAEIVDDYLVMEAQAGSSEALERLACRWHRRLHRHAWRQLGEVEGADEVMQESWLAIVRGLGKLDDPARFAPWAFRIVSRRSIDWIRRRVRRRSRHEALDESHERSTESNNTESVEGPLAVMRQAIAQLPATSRTILSMHYLENLPVAAISEVLDIPEGTVKSRLFNARKNLRAQLEESNP